MLPAAAAGFLAFGSAAALALPASAGLKAAASRLQKTAPSEWAEYQKRQTRLRSQKNKLEGAFHGFEQAEARLDREIKKSSLLQLYKKAYSEFKSAELKFLKAAPRDLRENQEAWAGFNHVLNELSGLLPERDRKWIEPWGTATTFWNSKKKYKKFRAKQRQIKYAHPEKWERYQKALKRLQLSMSAPKKTSPKEWSQYREALNKYRNLGHEARQAALGGKVDFWEKAFDELEAAAAETAKSKRLLREALRALQTAAPKELAEYNKAVFGGEGAPAPEKKAAAGGGASHFAARPPLKAAAGAAKSAKKAGGAQRHLAKGPSP